MIPISDSCETDMQLYRIVSEISTLLNGPNSPWLREYLALRDMGVQIDDSIRQTKFIQQDTTNTKHKQLAQTIFTTPNMTLGRAASLFETYNPPLANFIINTSSDILIFERAKTLSTFNIRTNFVIVKDQSVCKYWIILIDS